MKSLVVRATYGLLVLTLALVASCTASGRDRVVFPAHVAGTGVRTREAGTWTVTLEVARVAIGPIYFCTTRSADIDLCPEALAEVRDTATFDALDPTPQFLGDVRGISGTARSAMFDYGITFLLPATAPAAAPTAVEGAHSMHLEGTAVRDGQSVRFVTDVDVVSLASGVRAVLGVPTEHTLVDSADALVVRVDPAAWAARIDFDELAELPGDPVVLERDSTAYQSLLIAMTSSRLPVFEWARAEP